MKIGIIGSGNVGGVLGTRWAHAGHEVIFASRNPASDAMRKLVGGAGKTARAAAAQETVDAAELILLATPWPVTQPTLEGLRNLAGKVLIDATNPLAADLSGLEHGTTTSGGELVAGWTRGARVVKAFNSVGNNIMADPAFGADRPVMFYCGDDAAAKQTVRPLIEQLGFDAVDAGPLSQARLLEPLALLWISLAWARGLGRDIGFKFLRR